MGTIEPLYKGNYQYELPPVPKREEDILFYDKPKKEQYWRTPQFPSAFDWKRMDKRHQWDIVENERDRWSNGVWFFNKGVPTYITGMHYDHLTYATFEFGKARYLNSQRHDFYFRDYTRKDPKCFGRLWLKPRRYGMTLEEITDQTYTAIENENRLQGMMSDNKDKTMDTIFMPLVESYLKRPKFTRPDIYMPNGRIPKQKLKFSNGKASSGEDDELFQSDGCLNSLIQPKPTTMIGYDGWKLHYLTMDEVWKWKDVDPYKCWEKQKKCLMVGSEIVGKCSMLSTMGDDDSYAKPVEAGIKMYAESDPNNRLSNGQTITGLYRYFVSAIDAEIPLADDYGYIDHQQAYDNIMTERNKHPEGSKERMFECRRKPLTEEEALATANSTAIFDYKRIQARIDILTKTPIERQPSAFYDLHELPSGRIETEPKKWGDGKWQLTNMPRVDKDIDFTNRWYKDTEGIQHLYPNMQGCIGYDPVRFADVDTTSNSLSMAAALARQKFDYFGNGGAGRFNALMHYRPNDPGEGHYEVYKLAKLLGYPVMPERNVEAFKTKMIDLNARSFILNSPYDGIWGVYSDKSKKVIKDGVDLITGYYKPPKRMKEFLTDMEIKTMDPALYTDYIEVCEFIEVLKQNKGFNPLKTTIWDVNIAQIMLEIGLQQIRYVDFSENFRNRENKLANVLIAKRT